MSQPETVPADDPMLVTLRISDLRALIKAEIAAALNGNGNGHGGEPSGLLKLKGAAKYLNQSESWVYRHWKELGGKKLGGNIRFSIEDLERLMGKRGA